MIKPLKIANQTYANNLIQGPLAGVSCAPFRILTWQYSQPAFTYTEMISSKTLQQSDPSRFQRYIHKYPEEGPVCFQLAGSETNELATATKKAIDCGADLIDLNCGCPVKKIRKLGNGSKLLIAPIKLFQSIKAIKQNTNVPVGIKIRVEGSSDEKFHELLLQVIRDAGCDFITVHGRHWSEDYKTTCHYDQIAYFATQLSIPVLGNGDVACHISLNKILSTGCAGAVISRAGVGQPWLIRKLIAESNAEKFINPTQQEIGNLLLQHANLLINLLGNEVAAIYQMRKIGKYYARSLINKEFFVMALQKCVSLNELQKLIIKFFSSKQDLQ